MRRCTVLTQHQIGTPTASVSSEVAEVQRLLKASGLSYSMHSAGTTVEGSWDDVFRLMGRAHTILHSNGVVRIQTDIRAGTRTDKVQTFQQKVEKVESILAGDKQRAVWGKERMTGELSGAAEGVPIDAEGNQGHIAEQKGWKDMVAEAVKGEEDKEGEVKGAGVVTAPDVVGPGKVEGSWKGMVWE